MATTNTKNLLYCCSIVLLVVFVNIAPNT